MIKKRKNELFLVKSLQNVFISSQDDTYANLINKILLFIHFQYRNVLSVITNVWKHTYVSALFVSFNKGVFPVSL